MNRAIADGSGSSPHTRGARRRRRARSAATRIIPAYAGSTATAPVKIILTPDHPRIRGEHLSLPYTLTVDAGSSPHTRGAHDGVRVALGRQGIIPAYAGSTFASSHFALSTWDHPRIRGEHFLEDIVHGAHRGSSPHTRGARQGRHPRAGGQGIIPAYAGSTLPCMSGRSKPRDHPRIRGEHAITPIEQGPLLGSSPHTRGAQGLDKAVSSLRRIIPAYAGSTRFQRRLGVE